MTATTSKGLPLKQRDLWSTVRNRARVIFPLLGLGMVALILTSPLYRGPFSFLSSNAFAQFCMFWCLSVCTVLTFANRPIRPSKVVLVATGVALVTGLFFFLICRCVGLEPSVSTELLTCLSGAILGALAGTWLVYVLEVYARKR